MIRVVIREAGERRRRTLHDSGEWEPAALLSRQKSRFCPMRRDTLHRAGAANGRVNLNLSQ